MKNKILIAVFIQVVVLACKTNQLIVKDLTISDESFNFLVVGDWGRDGDLGQREVAQQMNKVGKIIDPEFVISTGDNFYDAGVASIDDPIWNRSFENIYVGGGLSKEWFVVLGNHDYKGNPQAQVDYTKKSRRWQMPARYFTLSRKVEDGISARFVFLDTSPFVKKYHKESEKYADLTKQDTKKQLKWLDSVLTVSAEKYTFVVGHHPIFSTGMSHGDTPELIELVKPILEKHKITAYFCGHDHDMQHQTQNGSEIEYFVSGAGSDVRKGVTKRAGTKYAEATHGFAAVSLTAEQMKLQFIDYKGVVKYSFQKNLTGN